VSVPLERLLGHAADHHSVYRVYMAHCHYRLTFYSGFHLENHGFSASILRLSLTAFSYASASAFDASSRIRSVSLAASASAFATSFIYLL